MPRCACNLVSLRRLVAVIAVLLIGLGPISARTVMAVPPTINRDVTIDDTNLLANTSRQCGLDVYLHQYGLISFKVATRTTGVTTIQETAVRVSGTYFAPSSGK